MSTGMGVGAAANIVGGELQGWAALLDKWAMQDAYQKQAGEQAGFRQQALDSFNTSLGTRGSQQAQKDLSAATGRREAAYADVNATPLSIEPAPLSGLFNQRVQAAAQLAGGQRAALGSYGDWLQNQYVRNQQEQRKLNQVSSFAGGSASVFPLQMYAAQHSMDDLAAVGQAISSIGGSAPAYQNLFAGSPGGYNLNNNPNLSGMFQGPAVDSQGQSFNNPSMSVLG